VRQLEALLGTEPVDVAYVLHVYYQLGTTVLPLLRRRGVPILLSLHDYKLSCPSYRLFDDRTRQICTTCFDRPHAYLWVPAVRRCWDGLALGGMVLTAEAITTRLVRAYRCADVVLVTNQLLRRGAIRAGAPPAESASCLIQWCYPTRCPHASRVSVPSTWDGSSPRRASTSSSGRRPRTGCRSGS